MKFLKEVVKTELVEIKPSQIYTSVSARENIISLLRRVEKKIIDFRMLKADEQFVAANTGSQILRANVDGEFGSPRFIVVDSPKVADFPEWE